MPNNINLAAEFICPNNYTNLYVAMIGDHLNQYTKKHIINVFHKINQNITCIHFNLSEVYKDRLNIIFRDNPRILILDQYITRDTINVLRDEGSVDPIDTMLIRKYITQINQDRFIFDCSLVDKTIMLNLTKILDKSTTDCNYIIYGKYLALHIFQN